MSKAVGAIGRSLMWSGVLILAFVAFQLWGTGVEERSAQRELGSELADTVADLEVDAPAVDADEPPTPSDVAEAFASVESAPVANSPTPPVGDGFGVIEIPKIGLTRFLVEGVSKAELKKGPGHYPGTPFPGQPGNVGIAGHRTTYGAPFNRIDELVPGDQIHTYTAQGEFVYEVVAPPADAGIERGPGYFTVRPEQSEVLLNQKDNRLTLTSCHPKRSAKQRIIVSAVLVGKAAAPPPTTAPAPTAQPANQLEEGFAGEDDALRPAVTWGIAAHLVVGAAWLIGRKWRKWPIALIATPVFGWAMWNCFYFVNRYLPSL